MSEIKLNLVDSHTIRHGNVHGSIGDACVAALSAEPETIAELEVALGRFIKQSGTHDLAFLRNSAQLDERPYDAGILIIDLAGRTIACDSTYSSPSRQGQVGYHNGECGTDIPAYYELPDDWVIVHTFEEYEGIYRRRREQRAAIKPLDARAIVYGPPLIEYIAAEILAIAPEVFGTYKQFLSNVSGTETVNDQVEVNEALTDGCEPENPMRSVVKDIHVRWLLTPREDLRGHSPRDVMVARKDFIDTDLGNRTLQWSMLLEGPPCLPKDSYAYRYAGFGSHEWIIYYELVRDLLWNGVTNVSLAMGTESMDAESLVTYLEEVKNDWLETPMNDEEGRIPAQVIENERKRLPEAMGGRSMVVDEDCPCCKLMGDEAEAGLAVYFWHLDGCHMDQDFAFSTFTSREKWEADQKEHEAFLRNLDREWKEREERLARGEAVESEKLMDLGLRFEI